jgi:plastocyanin
MSPSLSQTWYGIIGAVLLLAVLIAGCTGPQYGPSPTPAQTTPVPTTLATSAQTTVGTTATTVTSTATQTTPAPTPVQTPAPPVFVAVTIQNFAFSPASVTVPVGSTVTWTNQDAAAHQIASDTQAFMGNPLGQGSIYSFTFMTRGTFPYHCVIHPSMHGTVTVT